MALLTPRQPRGVRAARPNPRDCRLELHAEHLIEEHELIPRDAALLVGVSGGPDSVSLLDFLVARRERTGAPAEIVVGHVNHGLRGAESDGDQAFVQEMAALLGARCLTARVDPGARGESVEESARKLRYGALRLMAADSGAARVAVAHTSDDQAETVLLRLIRGAGLLGLGGMRPLRKLSDLELVRPLLTTTREQVMDYVKRRNLAFRTDSSNQTTDPRRNFVRLEVLPRIQRMNPSIRETLLREASMFREADAHLAAEAGRALAGVVLARDDGKIELDAEGLLLYPKLLRKYVLRFALQELNGDALDLSTAHIDALHALLTSQPGRSADIPMGIQARRDRGAVVLSKRKREPKRAEQRSNT
ncbi:MAG TPA: tRNA lysidine(34) synthetase TilS [Candidatus Binatia bacterium]|nr:tRNA lysidine(34) synthetase TilS [Candidatus Binatia bacterium]